MTKSLNNATIETLIEKASSYITDKDDLNKIREVYEYAKEKHQGQYRKSGEEYISHPLATAIILTTVYADTPSICAGLLHDVIEDCDTSKEEIIETFGDEIAELVYGVTKISKIHFSTENEALIEYYKKIIVGMSEDVRVIIIKLSDRLHNMRTLWALPEAKQKHIAKETLEILTPIAHHLGIHKLKSELEDLSLRYLKPDVFYDIAEKLNNTKLERDKVVGDMLESVTNLLKEHDIPHEIKGRSKSIYSIYKKLEKGRKFSDIYDLLALRVLVDTEQECYQALGIIHSKYRPIPKRFKDYVAMPKPNGYQSLHTTVFGIDGYLFEIQIRTHEMDEIAENGVASHWAYKEHKTLTEGVRTSTEAKLQFFKSIIELNEEKMSSEDFVNSVKNEILNNISLYDELTKIYNRRGFIEKSIELINNNIGSDIVIIFCDLDHLKEINDTFGHKEGDFAIENAARLLVKSLPEHAIISRLGGDEFVAMTCIDENITTNKIDQEIRNNFAKFNKICDKPYYIETSVGLYQFKGEESILVANLISEADKYLYEAKKHRRKSVKKINNKE